MGRVILGLQMIYVRLCVCVSGTCRTLCKGRCLSFVRFYTNSEVKNSQQIEQHGPITVLTD